MRLSLDVANLTAAEKWTCPSGGYYSLTEYKIERTGVGIGNNTVIKKSSNFEIMADSETGPRKRWRRFVLRPPRAELRAKASAKYSSFCCPRTAQRWSYAPGNQIHFSCPSKWILLGVRRSQHEARLRADLPSHTVALGRVERWRTGDAALAVVGLFIVLLLKHCSAAYLRRSLSSVKRLALDLVLHGLQCR
ncbi:hypothetical protein EVAR_30386_1 [Eumeta japonica]|uniref:Uncharacterized protein n=1 Tax=Eumeta variegata TaxID=151549 RepID=A0A4C1W804_EUMVA|nr:hypothetical protein EVAR_30386_1 [Eumeta japonica]